MKQLVPAILAMLYSSIVRAEDDFNFDLDIDIPLFRLPDGHTNWQHLANWGAGTFLILLSVLSVYLYLTRKQAKRANLELEAIRRDLERRVQERTATLNESNQLLKKSNSLLEQEITEHLRTTDQLRASESYIRDILTSMPLMLVGLNQDGIVTQWNRQVERASKIPADRALGRLLWDVYPTMTVVPEHIHKAIESNQPIHLKQSLRGLSHYDITIYPLQGKATEVVILIDDVSKETAAENMLIHNDKMSFMGELASSMAHDINAPLQGMLMDLKSFERLMAQSRNEPSTESQAAEAGLGLRQVIDDMTSKGEQVSKILLNLLSFSRGRKQQKQKADVVEVMESSIALANEVIAVTGGVAFNQVELERNFEKNLPLLPCYVTELQQVLLSLFRHACQALQPKMGQPDFEPRVQIILSESYDNLWIKIHHNGVGLSGEEQMVLFEPFFSSDRNRAEEFDAGQHLSFSYYIITEQHQGHMAVTSDVELGSTFHIQLPLER